MLCLSGFELYPRWVPLTKTNNEIAVESQITRELGQLELE